MLFATKSQHTERKMKRMRNHNNKHNTKTFGVPIKYMNKAIFRETQTEI